jgi:hypothetical protein
MLTGFIIDFVLGTKKYIFKKNLNNNSIMVENLIFILISLMFTVLVAGGESSKNARNDGLGFGVMGCIVLAFITLIIFKVKGKKAL